MNGENCSLCNRCANKGTFLCVDDAFNGSIGCFRYKTGCGTKYRRDNFEKRRETLEKKSMYGLGKEVRKMEKLYFILSLVLISIITVVNIESGWRFIEVEFLTAMLVMAPEFIGGLIRDIVDIIEDKKKEP